MAQTQYDLLLKGGHLIDPKNKIDEPMDVAIQGNKIAAISKQISPGQAQKVVNVAGCYVTPGLIDMHVHVYGFYGSLPPDSFALPHGATTVVDAGGAGWRTFEDFKNQIIFPTGEAIPTKTRVLALLNIVGAGMIRWMEQDLEDMDASPTAEMAAKYPEFIVGIKTAHFSGASWEPVDRSIQAGKLCGKPAMFHFAPSQVGTCQELFARLRPGDIPTHIYSRMYPIIEAGKLNPAFPEGRKKGLIFDVGHGAGSFAFRFAVPALQAQFVPDVISTDIHWRSLIARNATLTATMSKFLNMGMPLQEVIYRTTVTPAHAINRPELGHLSVGADADVAVLRLLQGNFGFVDAEDKRLQGDNKLECALTIRAGEVVWDLDGLSKPDW